MEIKCTYKKLESLEKLIPNPRNDNKHDEKHAQLLAKVIKARGIRHPIIVSKNSGFIVAGHLRLKAAQILGLEKFPIDEQEFETEADEYAFLTSDNNVARYAEFDKDKFIENMSELNIDFDDDFDFEEMGLLDFTFDVFDPEDLEDKDDQDDDGPKQFIVEVKYDNDMDARDLYDDLISKNIPARFFEK
ncbi:MAG: ParB N-terminal domain-containing protein [Thermoplasmatales archaeon]|nr:MAG: ParB N-terminal domain-containing protein [Thermoplasmatales archaeon]